MDQTIGEHGMRTGYARWCEMEDCASRVRVKGRTLYTASCLHSATGSSSVIPWLAANALILTMSAWNGATGRLGIGVRVRS